MKHLANKNILITGATGYLATNLAQTLREVNCRVVRFSRSPDRLSAMAGSAEFDSASGDMTDPNVWDKLVQGIDIIFHLAAQTSVPAAEENPTDDYRVNVLSTQLLLEACRKQRRQIIVIMAGTATQIGLTPRRSVNERLPDQPVTMYDLHKLMAEQYVEYYSRAGHIHGIVLRLFNVYGPGPASSSPTRGVLNQMIQKAIRGEDLSLYGKGNIIRDYVYIDDVIQALLKAVQYSKKLSGGHYYIGSGRGTTLAKAFRMVADRCASQLGRRVSVHSIPSPKTQSTIETRNYVADSTRFRRITHWTPRVILMDGIQRTIDHFSKG